CRCGSSATAAGGMPPGLSTAIEETAMRKLSGMIGAAALAGACLLAGPTSAAAPFYEGKTLSFIVGYAPGGSSDITCRLFAKHLSRFIEGNPTIVVRNMPGASGWNALNYVGEAARP